MQHPAYLGLLGYLHRHFKGMSPNLPATFVDSSYKVVAVKLHDRKHAITVADVLDGNVLPLCERKESRCCKFSLMKAQDIGATVCATRLR